uniref:DUF2177 family protein n=1 Tax=viral metagenome TaxID=1070528 RepID=A0A6C0D4H2_9ZZZZ
MIKKLITIAIILLALDACYLLINRTLFENQVIDIQRTTMKVKPISVIACYIFLIGGLYYFIIKNHRPVLDAFILGLVIYGVYETTTYALFKKWQAYLVFMDTLWGGTLLALTTYITYMI